MSRTPKIGAFVLETLTTGMYTNPLDTLREFVQNAADSIRKAEREGLVAKGEGRIEIRLDPRMRTLVVRDNGLGISQTEAYNRLINIGMSDKRIEMDAGFRGIGRLAGVAYCKILRFRTSTIGESVISMIELDCERLRQAISPALRQVEELPDIIAKNSETGLEDCKTEDHFFEVVMEGVTETASDFLEWQQLEKYLAQVAPVELDAHRFVFAPKISEWLKQRGLLIPTVTLVIKTPEIGGRQVFKPYKTHYKMREKKHEIDIKDIYFYPEPFSSESPFWLWYSKSDLLGMIDDERAAGLRLRKNNIAIGGPERVAELFANVAESYPRFNAYYIGEIHVISPEAIPNARRDGFEDVGDWLKIKIALMPFIRERCSEIRKLSQERNRPTEKVISTATVVIENSTNRLKTGFASLEERNDLLERVIKEEKRAIGALESRKGSSDAERIAPIIEQLEKVRQTLEQENHFVVKKLRSNLDRKQRKVIQEILQILYETLDKEQYEKAKAAILAKFQINDSESDSLDQSLPRSQSGVQFRP